MPEAGGRAAGELAVGQLAVGFSGGQVKAGGRGEAHSLRLAWGRRGECASENLNGWEG